MSSTVLAAEPTGASLFWTDDSPAIVQARQALLDGRFLEAQRILQNEPNPAAAEGIDLLHRLRLQFNVTPDSLKAQLNKLISGGVTDDQLTRWRTAGSLDYRTIDGQLWYYDRAAGNLFRRSKEARQLRGGFDPNQPTESDRLLLQNLADVVRAASVSASPAVCPKRFDITYTLSVDPLPAWVKPGSVARIWLPYPQENRQQTDLRFTQSTTQPTQIAPNGSAHRTVYYELTIADPHKPISVTQEFQYTCSAWYPKLDDSEAQSLKQDWGDKDLTERLPHIAFTPEMRATVANIIGEETNPLKKARLIFNWMDANIPWCAEQEYGNIPSLSLKALKYRTGDCGVQGCFFITMARIAGIPARWQTGWQLRPGDEGMHDWAEFYCEPWGWLPVDASYGLKPSSDPAVHEFYLGHQDSYRMTVNTDYGQPLLPPKQSLRSEPMDFQRGEVEIDGKNLYFDQWDYDFKAKEINP